MNLVQANWLLVIYTIIVFVINLFIFIFNFPPSTSQGEVIGYSGIYSMVKFENVTVKYLLDPKEYPVSGIYNFCISGENYYLDLNCYRKYDYVRGGALFSIIYCLPIFLGIFFYKIIILKKDKYIQIE